MNKLFTKIAKLGLGLAMAVGVCVAVGRSRKEVSRVDAATAEAYYQFTSKAWASHLKDSGYGTSGGSNKTWSGIRNGNASDGNSLQNGQGVQITTGFSGIVVTCPDSYNSISSVVVRYCTNASKGAGSIVAKVGTTSGSPASFTVSKPSSGGTTLKDATFNFSIPASGAVNVTMNCTANSLYLYGVHITYTTASSATLTGLRIASGTPNKLYEPGESFDGTGLTVYAEWDDEEDTEHNVLGDVVWNGGSALTAGTNQTITGFHADDENEAYPIQVTGVNVMNADFTHTYSSNSMFEGTSYSTTETKTYTPTNGPEYITLGGYNYSTASTMSLRNTTGMYVGNNEAYSKNILRIVVKLNSATAYSSVAMYEGPVALSEATTVAQKRSSDDKTLTYDFSDENQYFKFKSTSGTYINMESFKVFLGSAPISAVASEVTIATPGSVYVGKTLSLSATVSYTNKADDNKVTWAVTSGDGGTVDSSTGVFSATATTTTTITATSVEKGEGGVPVSASVTITPLANRITAVAWDTSNAKKTYNLNESLDISGITATGTNEAGDNDIEITLTAGNFSGFDSSAVVNSQTITISYPNEIDPSSPFTTTYTISVVATPDIYLVNTDFGNNYTATSLTSSDGTTWTLSSIGNYSSSIQIKDGSRYGMYNTSELGKRISKVSVNVKKGGVHIGFSASELNFEGTPSEQTSYSTLNEDYTYTVTGDYQFLRITPNGSSQLNYIKIWYEPFVPTVTLNQSSFEFTEGETGYCDVSATAEHFTNNSGVTFSATSSDQAVLDDDDILVVDNEITIDKETVNPGTVTVTVTGTYLTASEEAEASFTITCNAAARNLEYISITTPSNDTVFEKDGKFTINGLVVTGNFDAAPFEQEVTFECVFKLWNGSNETALTPGSTVLSNPGTFTIRVSHPDSAAQETLTYSIKVVELTSAVITHVSLDGFTNLYDTYTGGVGVSYGDSLESEIDIEAVQFYKGSQGGESVLQTNSSKTDPALYNFSAVPGSIRRITVTGVTNSNATPTIYFATSAPATTDNLSRVGGGKIALTDMTGSIEVSLSADYRYFFLDCNTCGGATYMTQIEVEYVENDTGAAMNFADHFLHMNDYDKGGTVGSLNGSGYCKDDSEQHYYSDTKTAYGKLTVNQKAEFAKLSAAVTRMQEWAKANTETFDPSAGTFSTQNLRLLFSNISNNSSIVIIVIISMVSMTAIGGYFFLRKRKEQ